MIFFIGKKVIDFRGYAYGNVIQTPIGPKDTSLRSQQAAKILIEIG